MISSSSDPEQKPSLVVVAGSRNFNDYLLFVLVMHGYLKKYHEGSRVVFITGMASRGADAMIIRYCKEFGYEWLEMPADWDLYGKSAGYRRNVQMCDACTHVIVFWDLQSPGTKHMADITRKAGKPLTTVLVQPDRDRAMLADLPYDDS